MLNSHTPRGFSKLHAIFLTVTGLFCLSCLVLSALMPRVNFEIGAQTTAEGNGVVVKRVFSSVDDIQPGDIIEAVSGKPVQTKTAFYFQLLHESDSADLTIRRTGNRFQRPVQASDFAHGAIPVGLHSTDKPVLIANDDGGYSPLEGVDFQALQGILESKSGAVSVVFRRQEEIVNATVELRSAAGRTFGCSLILVLFALMGLVAWKSTQVNRRRNYVWSNLVLGLGCVGLMTLGLWPVLSCIPIVLMFGMIGLTMFKVVDLDYHFVSNRSGKKVEPWIRIACFAGPCATLLLPIWLCICEMPVLWGGNIDSNFDLKPDTFSFLPMLWAIIYTFIDGGICLVRRHRNPGTPIQPYELGVGTACVLSIFVFALLRSDMMGAQWFLMGMILVQSLGNVLPFITQNAQGNTERLDNPMFSIAPVRKILDKAHELLGDEWLIQIAIDRPAPKHLVSLVRSDDEGAISGLEVNVLSTPWRDFLEVFRIEGGCITGESVERDPRDPVAGIAERLGIVIALPIADNVAGTLTSLTFLVSVAGEPDPEAPVLIALSSTQREQLMMLIDDLLCYGPAMVYQSAEISLDYVGEDLDEVVRQCHETASLARGLRNPTEPLTARELPHGLIDEDEEDLEDTGVNHNDEPIVIENPEVGVDECDTKVYEEEVRFLRSQVQALYSQQLREFALSEIEFTSAQKVALQDIESLDPPLLFIGEPGTGKRLLALAAHQQRSEGAFLTIDAAEMPESIFALDMFGDGINTGMIQSAAGGGLYIQNVDRVSEALLKDIMETIQKLPARDSIGLYLSVNDTGESFSVSQYRRDPMRLPKALRDLASQCDAEIIVVDPLRTQDDLDVVADFFRQKQAIRSNKSVESFTSEAMLALKSYRWPGNFNEMRSVIERAVMRCEGSVITVSDLGRDFEELADASTKNIALSETDVFREQVQMLENLNESQQAQIDHLKDRLAQLESNQGTGDGGTSEDAFLEGTFAEIEKRLLDKLLDKYQRDPEKTADALSLNRTRFFNKLSKYQLIKWDN
ncbi:MAG: sigma 54-interacting transcriptional regulator [Proteobacteria bacterium]|nr:sigma 54-interacting transcriptional regulator [Pseudomonadota bacterium]